MTPQETAFIRSQLALRYNYPNATWEVYTTIHGTGMFRWHSVTTETAAWYKKTFPEIKFTGSVKIAETSGALSYRPLLG